MRPFFQKLLLALLPENREYQRGVIVAVVAAVAGLLTWWGIHGIGQYGMALFILTPLLIGAGPAILYGLLNDLTAREARNLAFLTLGVVLAGLLLLAVEGLICIAMAAPIALLVVWLGSLAGYALISNARNSGPAAMVVLIGIIPTTAFLEKGQALELTSVVTSIEINASPQEVWKQVVEFPELDPPTEFLFRAGIAYPIHATISGTGEGAIRYCNFSTGSFVEPIRIWDEPRLLAFDVVDQPAPMKELSFWDIDAPHLHDYFVSQRGQFQLTDLGDGRTLLEGTTWYYHNIRPAVYWQLWSNAIVHAIHNRVLAHIRQQAEGGAEGEQ